LVRDSGGRAARHRSAALAAPPAALLVGVALLGQLSTMPAAAEPPPGLLLAAACHANTAARARDKAMIDAAVPPGSQSGAKSSDFKVTATAQTPQDALSKVGLAGSASPVSSDPLMQKQAVLEQSTLLLGYLTIKGFQRIWQIRFDCMGKLKGVSLM
jgi:hypothetical protein